MIGSMTRPITDLVGVHAGETAYIIGKGPSLLRLTEAMLGPGPIIALNQAIIHVRGYRAPLYSSQKDGCHLGGVRHQGKPCPNGGGDMIAPQAPEILLVSQQESPDCFADYEPRFVVDVERDFGVPWFTPSAPIMAGLALLMGCARIVFVSHDAYALGDGRAVKNGLVVPGPLNLYEINGRKADDLCKAAGIPFEWVTP
jgi:hypothetical protein